MTPRSERMKAAIALIVVGWRQTNRLLAAMGQPPATRAQLHEHCAEFREVEAVAPPGWIDLMERAALRDAEAVEILQAICEREDGEVVTQ